LTRFTNCCSSALIAGWTGLRYLYGATAQPLVGGGGGGGGGGAPGGGGGGGTFEPGGETILQRYPARARLFFPTAISAKR
jgi:hypothetical protein